VFARSVTASGTEARIGATAAPASERSAAQQARVQEQEHEQETNPANSIAAAGSSYSWRFGDIPLFPPDPADSESNAAAALPTSGVVKRELAIHDPLEHEADRLADQVMRLTAPAPAVTAATLRVSRKCAQCEAEEDGLVQPEVR
jgi:hypothetical protein